LEVTAAIRSMTGKRRASPPAKWSSYLAGELARRLALACALCVTITAHAAPTDSPITRPFSGDKTDRALEQAIDFLIRQQNSQGGISDRGNHNETAMTSLAILAMASVGHQPGDATPQGAAMAKALAFVLRDDRQDDKGYYGGRDGSRMYGHGIITLMLAEMIGHGVDEKQDKQILERCRKGVELILSSQKVAKDQRNRGGWRYVPDSRDSDLSVTVWQVMALRAAHNAGLDVPATAISSAVEYLQESYYSEKRDKKGRPLDQKAGFAYQPGGRAGFATTAAGLLAMQVCGQYEAPEVKGASEWLLASPPRWEERWLLYGTYYYAQGMHQRGGNYATAARQIIEDVLLPRQSKEGWWESSDGTERSSGRVYCTSLAVLSLSVKFHYLPIYQR
jgi:hypothetical protein